MPSDDYTPRKPMRPAATERTKRSHALPNARSLDHPIFSFGRELLARQNELKEAYHEYKREERRPQPRAVRERGVVLKFAQQISPRWQRFCHAESQHSQIGFCQYEERDGDPELREQDRFHVWQDVMDEEPYWRRSGGAGLKDKFRIAQAAHCRSHNSR